MHDRLLRITALTLLSTVMACSDAPPRSAVSVRDSAGIAIVENRVASWGNDDAWSVSPDARIRIGVADGDLPYQLFRVAGATRLSDGRIVVANGGTGELRFYASSGVHLRSVGRPGEGPGEFRLLSRLWRDEHDSLYAWDRTLGRLSIFDGVGRLARTVRLHVPVGRIAPRNRGPVRRRFVRDNGQHRLV